MTAKGEVYECSICGNVVQVIEEGDGELVCCGVPMDHCLSKRRAHHDELSMHDVRIPVPPGEGRPYERN